MNEMPERPTPPMPPSRVRRDFAGATRRVRELWMIGKALANTDHPVMAHIVPMRRCNLSCAYCNEYDDFSKPVPVETMYGRIDRLAELGTTIVTISGGEPLLHPELDLIISRIRQHGIIAGMITNGYLLTAERIHGLNKAGLDHLQISIDNVKPDDISKKSLKVLDKKLQLLSQHAVFHVNINSVVGGGIHDPRRPPAISDREGLCHALDYFVPSPDLLHRPRACSPDHNSDARTARDRRRCPGTGAHRRAYNSAP